MVIGIDASRANIDQRTGVENYAWHIIHELLPLLGDQSVRLYTRETLRSDWGALGARVTVKVLHWLPKILWTQIRLSWEMIFHRPDVLFVPATSLPPIHPGRTIATIHDVAFERWPNLYQRSIWPGKKWASGLLRLLSNVTGGIIPFTELELQKRTVRQALKESTTILTVSEFTKNEIVALFDYPAERIVVTPLATDGPGHIQNITTDELTKSRRRFNLTGPYFIFVGRLEEKKNIGSILKSYLYYHQHGFGGEHLVLVGNLGDGWPVDNVELNGMEQYVHILGWQPGPVVDELLLGARALIFVSRYEGFGLPALEALSAGIPVLANRQGAIMEVLGENAVYTDPNDTAKMARDLLLINTDQALRDRLTVDGKKRTNMFSWKNSAAITARVITDKYCQNSLNSV